MLPKSISSQTLTRSDSGIDIDSEEGHGVVCQSYRYSTSGESAINLSATVSETSQPNEQGETSNSLAKKFCPPKGPVVNWLSWVVVLCAIFGAMWALFPSQMVPYQSEFSLVLTIMLCFVAEQVLVKIPTPKGFPPLPPLLASLLMGLALKNLPAPLNIAEHINPETSSHLRELALTIILTRAGLEIDPEGMRMVKWAVFRLAFMPCLAETTVIGILGHYVLGFPFEWSFASGFMIAAVSPAVVIPSLIILQDVGFGVEKGVPALVMAASGIDDVLAIAGFTVLLGIAIPSGIEDGLINKLLSGAKSQQVTSNTTTSYTEVTSAANMNSTQLPHHHTDIGREIGGAIIEVVIGIVAGLVLGFIISYIPPRNMRYKSFCRGVLLLTIGILFVFGSEIWGIPGSGALCALITSFVASLHWKKDTRPLEKTWHYMWVIFQPILFGLTGTLVQVEMMRDAKTVGLGLTVLLCGLVARLMMSTSVTFGLNFNLKERIFVSIAWIPKGTVQAALGSAALDLAISQKRPQIEIEWGEQILVLAVLITLITAPLGGFGINLAGPKLLTVNSGMGPNPQVNEAYDETESHISKTSVENGHHLPPFNASHRGSQGSALEIVAREPPLEDIEEENDGEVEKDMWTSNV